MATRRRFLGLTLPVAFGLAGCNTVGDGSQTPSDGETGTTAMPTDPPPTPGADVTLGLETITDRPDTPVAFVEGTGGTRYVADRPGTVYRLDDGSVETALDLTDAIMTGRERGLLGLALHPEFAVNDRLYIRYSSQPRSGTPDGYSHTFVLSEFRTRSDGTINQASERVLLEIPQPQGNHNSGSLAFGPEGYLYVGVGDGGASGDTGRGHVEDWYEENDGGNGQDVTENPLGSLLRIDVDDQSGGKPYGIPEDNPLVGQAGLDEHYAWGLRNPWGISFDSEDLYVADVGQGRYEEVNRIEAGGNYGWNVYEGTHCFRTDSCPTATDDGERLLDPVIEYPHSGEAVRGVAVVGGHVYRGSAIPALSGLYVFGDLAANGRLFVAAPDDDGRWATGTLQAVESSRDKLQSLIAIGRDTDDELYALNRSGVHRLVAGN